MNIKVRELSEADLIDMLKGSCIQSTRTCDSSESISLIKKARIYNLVNLAEREGFEPSKGY